MSNLQNYLATAQAKIAAHGWLIQFVGADPESPQFHYTVGLFPVTGFEIVTFGLSPTDGGIVLNELAERVHSGARFTNGQTLTDVLANDYAVTLLETPDASALLTIARRLYLRDGMPLPAWQIIFPDAEGKLPWDPAYTGAPQPLLSPPPQ